MWKIFFNNKFKKIEAINSIENWKEDVFFKIDNEVKKYFAKKITNYFDNLMIFNARDGMHENLMLSLSTAEKELNNLEILFPEVRCFWFFDENTVFLIVQNLSDDEFFHPSLEYGFSLLKKNNLPLEDIDKLRRTAWESLVFNINISNFAKGWIDYAPSLEERALLQTKTIIYNNYLKNKELSLIDKLKIDENIQNFPQFNGVYEKVMKIMPKIASSLNDEWKTTINSGEYDADSIKKKIKIKTR